MNDPGKRSQGNPINSALVNGGLLIVVGILLLLDQMGIISHWFNFWAAVFFFVGLLNVLQPGRTQRRVWGAFLVAIGLVVELDYLGYARVRLETIWPVFVIAAGLVLIWRAYQPPTETGGVLAPTLNVFAIWGGGEYRIRAKDFRGGDLVAFMGGFDVDLRDADIEGDQATITVNAFMGGGVIRVPETWAVSMQVAAFMGGHSLKAREGAQVLKTLIVKGFAVMGGVEVRN
jgi:predicted membrane protein